MDLHNTTVISIQANCTVDTSYRFTYYKISYSVIFIFGVVSNATAMRHFFHMPPTFTSTAVYMANQTAGDIFFVISLPLRIYYYHIKAATTSNLTNDWSPGGALCQLTFMLKYITLYGGIFFLVCIGVDRYFAVVHPLHQHLRKVRTARTHFFLCFTPYHLNLLGYTLTQVGLVHSCGLAQVTKVIHPVVLSLASTNCCLNPLIYYFSSSLVHKEPTGSRGSASQ